MSILINFLKEKLRAMPLTTAAPVKVEVTTDSSKHYQTAVHTTQLLQIKNSCSLCQEEYHPLYMCQTFRSMSLDNRNIQVRSMRLCLNCLSSGHKTKECRSIARCKKCNKPHHTSLHISSDAATLSSTSTQQPQQVQSSQPSQPPITEAAVHYAKAAPLNHATMAPLTHTDDSTLQMTSQVTHKGQNIPR